MILTKSGTGLKAQEIIKNINAIKIISTEVTIDSDDSITVKIDDTKLTAQQKTNIVNYLSSLGIS